MLLKQQQWRRKAQLSITAAACLLLFVLIHRQHIGHLRRHDHQKSFIGPLGPLKIEHKQNPLANPLQTSCRDLPGATSIFVLLKTSAATAHAALPIHLSTTLRCIPHFALYSDLADTILGHPILDALAPLPASAHTNPDLALHAEQQAWRAQALNASALAAAAGNATRAAALDRWKPLPLLAHALATAPAAADWFLLLDADAAAGLLWRNLLAWVAALDPTQPVYAGAQTWWGDDDAPFARAGAGVLLSRPAVAALAAALESEPDAYVSWPRAGAAADHVLGLALGAVGVELSLAWPVLQGEAPWSLDYGWGVWCRPVVSWGRMDAFWVRKMWEFERVWNAGGFLGEEDGEEPEELREVRPIRHGDIFEHFVAPHVLKVRERRNWDNLSPDVVRYGQDGEALVDKNGCWRACEEREECLQWLWIADGTCRTATVVRLGEKAEEVDMEGVWMTSGWMGSRIERMMEEMRECENEDWTEE
ncbi:hypothetical protein GTA08_BOTSDO05522 [Neofusicoccum parvum]|uniref:Uncharacterized protein n=1 Tax=Neofusicoccum parvum TaxID=310453 RepID=A0ACB5RQT1_9PEZI|nr:hypothetical protein GTA08_BOTSDO05522 [Neofusicoccum parvum]